MAASDNTNSTSSEKNTEPVVKTGDNGSPARAPLSRASKKKIFMGLCIIIVIAVAVVLTAGKSHFGPKVYAQAAGHKIYKQDVQNIRANNKSVSDHDAATVLADKYLSQAMAQEQNVTVSRTNITAADCPSQKSNPYGYQTCVNQVYFTKLANNNAGVYEGKYIIAGFGRYVPYQTPLLAEQEKRNPKIGNPASIAADKAYARTFITSLYNQIKAGTISFDQAIKMERNDPIVGERAVAYESQPHSGTFNGPLSQTNALAAPSIKQKITNMKAGETTKPFVVRVSDSATDLNSTAESYFLIVKMGKASSGHGKVDFQQELQQAKKKLGYEINV